MREVAIIGVSMIKFGRYPDRDVSELAAEAAIEALKDAGAQMKDIEAFYSGNLYSTSGSGQRILQQMGQTGIPVVNVANACATGSTAFREGYFAVASGAYDMVMAVGSEQMGKQGLLGVGRGDPAASPEGRDGTYLMMPSEIVTSIQEGIKINLVVVENNGFASIGGLSQSLGNGLFGTVYRKRNPHTGQLDGEHLPINFAENAHGFGAEVFDTYTLEDFKLALQKARSCDRTSVIVVHTDTSLRVPGYACWWDVAVAEVSAIPEVKLAREHYSEQLKKEKIFFPK